MLTATALLCLQAVRTRGMQNRGSDTAEREPQTSKERNAIVEKSLLEMGCSASSGKDKRKKELQKCERCPVKFCPTPGKTLCSRCKIKKRWDITKGCALG